MPDRKITFRLKPPEYRDEKVQSRYYPIVVGFAGSVELSQMFITEAYELAQQQSYENHVLPKPPERWARSCSSGAVQFNFLTVPEYHVKYDKYTYDCGQPVSRINRDYSAEAGSKFEVVMITHVDESKSRLCHIDTQGGVHDGISHQAIGSSSVFATSVFNDEWTKDMNMKQTAELSYCTVKCIEDKKIDDGVGLGGGVPDIWFIPNSGQIYHATPMLIKEFDVHAEKRMSDIVRIMKR